MLSFKNACMQFGKLVCSFGFDYIDRHESERQDSKQELLFKKKKKLTFYECCSTLCLLFEIRCLEIHLYKSFAM